jgi:endonuclease/exonuclease/phosphatase family metal-dependent hydrolase
MSSTLIRVAVWFAAAALVGCRSSDPGEMPQVDASASDSRAPVDGPADAVPPIDGPAIDAPPVTGERIRLVAGNLTSGNNQAYQDPGIRILRGLHADVALVQEFNVGGNTPAELQGFIESAFGPGYAFVRGEATQDIPNGIVTRFPIRASGEWQDSEAPDREYVWAQIDIPGDIDLYAISVHLLSTGGADRRDIEARELVQNIEGLPANTYVVLGGDFNTGARTEPCVQTLSSVLVTSGPFPADQAGVSETNAARRSPYDWVLANAAFDAREVPVVIGANQFADGLVADTRVYTPISDLAPAQAGDSGASMMQHMAVIRDFAVPGTP